MPSEKSQRTAFEQQSSIYDEDTMEYGKMELFRTAKSQFTTAQAFCRANDLAQFIEKLYKLEMLQTSADNTMKNLNHPLYMNKVWVSIQADKGGTLMKYMAGVGTGKPRLIGMFQATNFNKGIKG